MPYFQNGEFPMYAFVTFEDEDDAEALIESTQLHTIKGATLNLAYAAGHTMKEQYATHTPQARYKPKVPYAARAPHAPHVPHVAPAASVPAPKPQPRRKSIDAACMEIMDDFIEQIYAGKLGKFYFARYPVWPRSLQLHLCIKSGTIKL